jgi:hypothetical protein
VERRIVASLLLTLAVCLVVIPLAQGQAPLAGKPAPADSGPVHLYRPGLAARGATAPAVQLAAQGWTTMLSEDFERDFPGTTWTLSAGSGAPAAYWGQTSYRAHGGTHSVYCAGGGDDAVSPPGPYLSDMDGWMQYGPFDLSQAIDAEVEFYHWTHSEVFADPLWLVASNDGANWSGTHWSGDWAGPSHCSGWCQETFTLTNLVDLGNLCGQPQVWIAFVFRSDSGTQYEGSYIDDVTLRALAAGTPAATATATARPTGTPTATATATARPSPTPTLTPTPTPTATAVPTRRIYLPIILRARN